MSAKIKPDADDLRVESFDNVFDALFDDDPGMAATLKLRSQMLMNLRATVSAWPGTQQEKARRLKIRQPRLSLLLKSENTSAFDLDQLVAMNVRAGLVPHLKFVRPRPVKAAPRRRAITA